MVRDSGYEMTGRISVLMIGVVVVIGSLGIPTVPIVSAQDTDTISRYKTTEKATLPDRHREQSSQNPLMNYRDTRPTSPVDIDFGTIELDTITRSVHLGQQRQITTRSDEPSEEWNVTYSYISSQVADGFDLMQTNSGTYVATGWANVGFQTNYDGLAIAVSSNGTINDFDAYGGTGQDGFFSTIQTSDGGYLFVGFAGSDSFDRQSQDAWVVKVGPHLEEQWNRTYDMGGSEVARAIVPTWSGDGYIIAGYRENTNDRDGLLLKISANGTLLKTNTIDSVDDQDLRAITRTNAFDRRYAVAGWTKFGIDGKDAWALEISDDLSITNQVEIGGSGDQVAYGITGDGTVFRQRFLVAGVTETSNDRNGLVAKLDFGNTDPVQWKRDYGASTTNRTFFSITTTSSNDFVLGGEVTVSVGPSQHDLLLTKLAANGTKQWGKWFGGDQGEDGAGAILTNDGGYALVGSTSSYSDGIRDLWLLKAEVNQPPSVSDITWSPTNPTTSDSVEFTATASDPDGDSLGYTWEFGDGTTATGNPHAHRYTTAGNYTVAVTVSDGDGGSTTYSETVSVKAGLDVNNNNRSATDPDSDGLYEDVDGDGQSTCQDPDVLLNHRNAAVVQNNVDAFDFDGDGSMSVNDITILKQEIGCATNSAPTVTNISWKPTNPSTNEMVTFTATATDSDGAITRYTWDFNGDGQTEKTGESVTYKYASSGSHTVVLTVVDNSGANTSEERTLTVKNTSDQTQTTPTVKVAQAPDSVQENQSFTIDYTLTANDAALTVKIPNLPSGINVSQFSGAIKSQNVAGNPPTASTKAISSGSTATVSVTYEVGTDIVPKNQTSVDRTIEVAVNNPLSGARDSVSTSLTVKPPAAKPSDPRKRALQIAGVDNPTAITQTDITIAITKFNRGEKANGLALTQNDITVLITLFERNN